MQKLDKIFAGLILVAMALFWVIMSPAAVTSRISEAKPVSLEQSANVETNQRKGPLTPAQKLARDESIKQNKAIARLKERKRDTPVISAAEMSQAFADPGPIPQDGEALTPIDDIPDLPVFY